MSEIGEEGVAKRIIADILDGGTSVGIGVGLLNLDLCERGKAFQPRIALIWLSQGYIDEFLVCLDRVRPSRQRSD